MTLSSLVNQQNQAGLDLNGDPGQALMSVGSPAVVASSANTGSATVSASVSDLSGLTTSNYYLKYSGTTMEPRRRLERRCHSAERGAWSGASRP